MQNERHGTFSSSGIWKLLTKDKSGTKLGAPAMKYIKQVQYEIDTNRPIAAERDARPTSWGLLAEKYVFSILPTSYQYLFKKRFFYPGSRYSGAPDVVENDTVGDIKSPTLEVFLDKLTILKKGIEAYKDEYPEDYWQHISNAILLNENGYNIKNFEAILFCPYKSELDKIREMAGQVDDPSEQRKYYWIAQAMDDELPWIEDGGKFKNVNIFRFPVPEDDTKILIPRVTGCSKILIPRKS